MKIAIGLCLIFISACVSQNTILVNERGQTAQCQNWGFGLIGASLAYAEHRDCVKKANAAGYTNLASAPAAKPAPAKSPNPNAN